MEEERGLRERLEWMANKNKGFSVIEMIVTVAVLAIIGTGTITLLSRIGYANTMKAANKIDSLMDKVRIETMSKEQKQYLYLYNMEDVIYMKVSTEQNSELAVLDDMTGEKIGKNIVIYYKSPSEVEKVLEEESLCISFERSSGAFSSDYETIKFVSSGKTAMITFVKETGRHWLE